MGSGRSPKRRVRDDDFIVGYRRIWSDMVGLSSNRLSIGRSTSGSFHWNLELQAFVAGAVFAEVGGWLYLLHALEMRFHMWRRSPNDIHFAWQAQYLLSLKGGFTCSTHWKWRFICHADHRWPWFCVAGAVFGEVGGWLDLLHALEMRFHMRRRSLMTFILRGRRSICWGWRVTLLAPRIGNEVSYVTQISQWHSFCVAGAVFAEFEGWLYLLHALEMTFHMSRRSSMTMVLRGRRSIWWGWRVTFICDADH